MKKKLLAVILSAVLLFLCACAAQNNNSNSADGASENSKQVIRKITMGELTKNNEGNYFVTEEQMKSCTEKVTLTKKNWKNYLGDYTEVKQQKNTPGNAKEEYTVRGFGLKPGLYGSLKGVSLKFSGAKMFGYVTENGDGYENAYLEYIANKSTAKVYDESGMLLDEGNRANWVCHPAGSELRTGDDGYFIAEFGSDYLHSSRNTSGIFYSDYDCVDITGEIIIVHLPDELFGEEWVQFGDVTVKPMYLNYDQLNKYLK